MQPCLLIASPQMTDPFFEQTVVLVWHHDEDGAVGVVINRPLDHALSEVLEGDDFADWPGAAVCWGGPVDRHSASVVLRGDLSDEEGWMIEPKVSVTRSEERLRRAIAERTDLRLCLGYAGWGAGQLEHELSAGGWLYTEPTEELVFDTPSHELYERALLTLGLTPSTVLMTPGEA